MKRRKMPRRKDKAIFKRTAVSVAVANLPGHAMRGGIRL